MPCTKYMLFQLGVPPIQVPGKDWGGGTPFHWWGRGTPFSGLDGGYPLPRSGWGIPHSQVRIGGGYPFLGLNRGGDTPFLTWEGVPTLPGWDQGRGYPLHPDLGRGTPCPDLGRGYPHRDLGRGYPHPDLGTGYNKLKTVPSLILQMRAVTTTQYFTQFRIYRFHFPQGQIKYIDWPMSSEVCERRLRTRVTSLRHKIWISIWFRSNCQHNLIRQEQEVYLQVCSISTLFPKKKVVSRVNHSNTLA